MALVKGNATTSSSNKVNQLNILEKEIIRILLLYGNEEVGFVNWVDGYDKFGKPILEKEEYTNTVCNEIYLNLQEDEVEFTNEVFKTVYYELIHQLNQDEKISLEQLIGHENITISSLVTNILMDEEKYSLSDWSRKEIFVTKTAKILPKLVTDAMLNLRRVLIEKKINEILNGIKNEQLVPDLEEINNYTDLKKRLFEKLNRVV
jgi:DNA primase